MYNPSDINGEQTNEFGADKTTKADHPDPDVRRRALNHLLAKSLADGATWDARDFWRDSADPSADLLGAYKGDTIPPKVIDDMQRGATWAISRGARPEAVRDIVRKVLAEIEARLPVCFGPERDAKGNVKKSLNPWERVDFALYWKQTGPDTFVFDIAQLFIDLQAAGRASTREMFAL